MSKKGIIEEGHQEKIKAKYDAIINDLIKIAESTDPPAIETLFTDVYQEQPWNLQEQLQELSSIKRRGS